MSKTILVTYAVKEEFIPLEVNGYNLVHIHTGVGKTQSAYTLTKSIYEHRPELVLNVGTAGTLQHSIGDIFIAKHFIDRDYETINLPGISYEINGMDFLDFNPELKKWVSEYGKLAICNTGDTFVTEASSLSGDVVDMEAYAQAFVCKELGIPFLSVKYITDIIGQNSIKHWEDKLEDSRIALLRWFEEYNILSLITS